ncbi:low temperature requirement protein A, partial [Chloroflexota bacterium]
VYVDILIELGNRLSHDLTIPGVMQFLFLFIIVWVSWLENVLFERFFPNDDLGQRLLTFFYMALMGIMAFNIHDISGASATAFLLAYAASKLVMALMYGKALIQYPQYRRMTRIYIVMFLVAASAWFAIAIFAPTYFLLWAVVAGVGILAQAILPLVQAKGKKWSFELPPTKMHYMRHRFGELTIIVLGEFFIKVITSASDRDVYLVSMLYYVVLLSISTSLWWLYFDHQEHSTLEKRQSRMEIWVYIHYPLLAAITAYGVVGNKVIALMPGEALSDPKRWLFCTALAVAVASTAVIEWASREGDDAMSRRPQILFRCLGALALLAVAILGGGLSVPLLVVIVAGIVIFLVGLDVSWRLLNPVLDSETNPI